jgi:hypothetical protein
VLAVPRRALDAIPAAAPEARRHPGDAVPIRRRPLPIPTGARSTDSTAGLRPAASGPRAVARASVPRRQRGASRSAATAPLRSRREGLAPRDSRQAPAGRLA